LVEEGQGEVPGMCDIYIARCAGCGREIWMHLGDFLTNREEVETYCARCFKKIPTEKLDRTIVWMGTEDMEPEEFILAAVVSLTENAWKRRFHNHPNWFNLLPLLPAVEMWKRERELMQFLSEIVKKRGKF